MSPVSLSARCFWLNFLMSVPGTKATRAMANSFKMVSQEKRASRDVRVDRMEPVCTQMKLYGIKPGKWKVETVIRGAGGPGIQNRDPSCLSNS